MNNLTGRSQHSPCHCTVSASAVAPQLIRNSRYEGIDRESSRLISQEVSDLWKATPTSPVNISESFTSQEFATTLKHLKPGKAPGSDSICPELITHAGAALKSWLCGFLSSCLRHLKIPKFWRRALVVAIPKPKKLVEDPKSYRPISLSRTQKALRKKLSTRVALLRRLAGSGWDAGAKTLRISALSLVYSTAEYYAPVWCRSTHTHLIDSIINDALRIVSGCLRPTPTEDLHVLTGIQLAELQRLGATLSWAKCAIHDPDHVVHGQLVE